MNKSENIGSFAKAWANYLAEVKDPIKNRVSHNNRYADLNATLDTARSFLPKNDLAVYQDLQKADAGYVCIRTEVMHVPSGESRVSEYQMQIVEAKGNNIMHATGQAITYARRYALYVVLAISATDDEDGNVESNSNKKLTGSQIDTLMKECNNNKQKIEGIMKWANINNINELTLDQYIQAMEIIKKQNGA